MKWSSKATRDRPHVIISTFYVLTHSVPLARYRVVRAREKEREREKAGEGDARLSKKLQTRVQMYLALGKAFVFASLRTLREVALRSAPHVDETK